MRIRAILASLALAATVPAAYAPPAGACQYPPGSVVPCSIVPEHPIVNQTDPFKLYFTITNFPTTAPFPPPYLDDTTFAVSTFTQGGTRECNPAPGGQPGFGKVDPATYSVELDEAWSPFADEPTSDTHELVFTPQTTGDYYSVSISVCGGSPTSCPRRCSATICIPATADPTQDPVPYAEFVEPEKRGDAGSPLPFGLRVLRNGYTPGVPLTVRVLPENRTDPIDIFPLTPPGLSTTGYVVTGDDEKVDLHCDLHYPCFVGVDNVYHVTIHDGATLLWDSRVTLPGGIGRALVTRSPMARQELVEVLDDGGDGALATGEHGFLHLRLFGRNPYFAADLTGAAIETDIPAGLGVDRYQLHFHDNPMDTYDPTPAELLASGTSAGSATVFRIETPRIEARFATGSFTPPPTVFRDMFEIEVWLETPAAGFPAAVDLTFPGARVTATAAGLAKAETSGPLVIPVRSGRPPSPIDRLLAVRDAAHVRLSWDDSRVDGQHGPATSYHLHRSGVPGSGFSLLTVAPDTAATREELVDQDAVPGAASYYYRLSAWNADGHSSDEP